MQFSRLGFQHPDLAERNASLLGSDPEPLVEQVAAVADPDAALSSLADLAVAFGAEELRTLLRDEPVLTERLLIVLGTSRALGAVLARHPQLVHGLGPGRLNEQATGEAELRAWMLLAQDRDQLRERYYEALLAIATRDLNAYTQFPQSSAELSHLAVATLDAALQIARAGEPGADLTRLTIMAMGKTGGYELNYISDVDVIFVAEPADGADSQEAMAVATRLASTVMRICRDHTREGTIWEVDANLRPEGQRGALVRSLGSHIAYYERWASTWEFQALLKARYAAGDRELAEQYLAALSPMVWNASTRDNFVADVRAMRRRVVENIPQEKRARQLKLGSGGLRDVEFAVQLLQLVHGRVDESVRSPTTLTALAELIAGGYVARRDGSLLEDAYYFLRTLEHRIQLYELRRSHIVPDDPEDLRRIGRSMGFRVEPVDNLVKEWQAHRRVVSRLHEKLFYRPLLDAVVQLPTDDLRLTSEAARERLSALGFVDPVGALAHISSLTSGVSRRAAIQQSLLPAMLAWFSESPDPDRGLLAFRQISEELGDSHWYLRTLRDQGAGAEQLAKLLSSSQYVANLITRGPDIVTFLGDDAELVPHDLDRLSIEMELSAGRHLVPHGAVRAIRRVRRRELARIAMADVLGRLGIIRVGAALTAINTATLRATLRVAEKAWEKERGPLAAHLAIVLMGRLGGHEAGYSSDADVMFVYRTADGADDQAAAACAQWIAQLVRQSLGVAGADPALPLDADLRPEGKNGPLTRSFGSYAAYYAKWSDTWEAQALLRADPVVGDEQLCRDFRTLIDPLRYPEAGLSDAEIREIRRIKARVEAERLPRGGNPLTHLKLGRGGLADIEWTIQLLQMRHAHQVPGLRTTETIAAIEAATDARLISQEQRDALVQAWQLVSRIRNAVVLWRGRAAEHMVEDPHDRAGLAHLLGFGQDHSQEMVEHYLRVTRRARQVVDAVFWQ